MPSVFLNGIYHCKRCIQEVMPKSCLNVYAYSAAFIIYTHLFKDPKIDKINLLNYPWLPGRFTHWDDPPLPGPHESGVRWSLSNTGSGRRCSPRRLSVKKAEKGRRRKKNNVKIRFERNLWRQFMENEWKWDKSWKMSEFNLNNGQWYTKWGVYRNQLKMGKTALHRFTQEEHVSLTRTAHFPSFGSFVGTMISVHISCRRTDRPIFWTHKLHEICVKIGIVLSYPPVIKPGNGKFTIYRWCSH